MNFLITGGSGFIGSRLSQSLINANHNVTILTRNIKKTASQFKGKITLIDSLNKATENYDIIVNLAGESIAKGRWTEKKKKRIYESRLKITKKLTDYIIHKDIKPQLLISGSAIGYYGNSDNEEFIETSKSADNGFTHNLCQMWEQTAYEVKKENVRVCCLRTGIVLGLDGGALASMLFPFEFCLGGTIGNGKQWMSWIHIDDLIRLFEHIINHKSIEGPINATAPYPVTNKEFTEILGKIMRRPTLFTVPAWLLKLCLGEMAETLLLKGQKVLPKKALDTGYQFKYKKLKEALHDIIKLNSK